MMILMQVELKLILIKCIFFQEYIQKITTLKLMEETFTIDQLMVQLNNIMKLERLQQEKEMIAQQVVCLIIPILTRIINQWLLFLVNKKH